MSEQRFRSSQQHLFQLLTEVNHHEALNFIMEMEQTFPDRLDKIAYWKACVYIKMKDEQAALEVLENALYTGVWWNPVALSNDNDLKLLEKETRFKQIVSTCQKRFDQMKKESKVRTKCFGNAQADVVIISLHWRGSNIEHFSSYWLSESLTKDYFYLFIQSSQAFGYDSYCWDDLSVAEKDISKALKEVNFEGKRIILTGASQGAMVGLEFLLKGKINADGFIFVVPAVRDVDAFTYLLKQGKRKQIKGYIYTGNEDTFYKKTVELTEVLNRNDIQTELFEVNGMAHFFPKEFPTLLPTALEYVLT